MQVSGLGTALVRISIGYHLYGIVTYADRVFKEFPECSEPDFTVTTAGKVTIKVSDFLEVGGVADHCDDESCENSHTFQTVSEFDCSLICSKIADCEWWSASHISRSAHLNHTICSLFNNGGSPTVSGMKTSNSTTGHRSCSPTIWPSCAEQDLFIEGKGYSELWVNATARFGFDSNDTSCHKSNCDITDKFTVPSLLECTAICSRIMECKYWSVTKESDGRLTCWLRRNKISTSNMEGSVSGNMTCANHAPYIKLPDHLF